MLLNSSGGQELHLSAYLYVLRKRRHLILFFAALVLIAGITFTFFERVLYRANSTILIERENPNVVDFKEVLSYDSSSTDYYQTQYEILASRSLAEQLIKEEKLAGDPYLKWLQNKGVAKYLRVFKDSPGWIGKFVAEPSLGEVLIRHMLRVKPIRNTRLVEVSILYPEPGRAAELTNKLVELYIQRSLKDRYLIATRATELIANQLAELKEKVNLSERALQDYKEKSGLVNIPSIHEKDKFLQDARLELVKAQGEEGKLLKRYLPAHPKLIHVHSQVVALQEKIKEEENKDLNLSRAAIEYSELEREAEGARQIYKALLTRLEETQSQAQTQASNVIVVDRASAPPRPYTPRPFLNLAVSLLLGIFGGIALAFLAEYFDSSIKIPEDIEEGLGLSLLGIIPDEKGGAKKEVFFQPGENSPAAESFRALRTVLLFKTRHIPGCRVFLVTSPNPGEGKSTVATNLAVAFAHNHLKVLLVDGDLRKPRLHQVFSVSRQKGLKELLEGENFISDVIHQNAGGLGIDFLSCGDTSDHPTEILGAAKMKTLVETWKRQYDVVIFDTPPFLAVADVAVLSEYADMMVIVTAYQKTDRRHLRDLKRRFNDTSLKSFGAVINRVSVREKDYYYHQYYYYGYGEEVKKK